jgi:phosphatidylserine/phosphatidylglycerophosphate/cardiolipin synthase-like enzyme
VTDALAPPSLVDVSTSSLERLIDGLRSGHLRAPLSRNALIAFGVAGQLDSLSAVLSGHSKPACLAILQTALAERQRAKRPTPELVWTGPEGAQAQARDTAVVLRELFESARKRVVLAGYSFKNAESVLQPLAHVMVTHCVEVHFFVDVPQPERPQPDEEAYGQAQLKAFLQSNWPFKSPPPKLYCDRRALRPGWGSSDSTYCSLHAKCVSVDSRRAFVSSANFTLRGQDRNIETGVLIDDPHFAVQLDRQWMSLVDGGFVLRGT